MVIVHPIYSLRQQNKGDNRKYWYNSNEGSHSGGGDESNSYCKNINIQLGELILGPDLANSKGESKIYKMVSTYQSYANGTRRIVRGKGPCLLKPLYAMHTHHIYNDRIRRLEWLSTHQTYVSLVSLTSQVFPLSSHSIGIRAIVPCFPVAHYFPIVVEACGSVSPSLELRNGENRSFWAIAAISSHLLTSKCFPPSFA